MCGVCVVYGVGVGMCGVWVCARATLVVTRPKTRASGEHDIGEPFAGQSAYRFVNESSLNVNYTLQRVLKASVKIFS